MPANTQTIDLANVTAVYAGKPDKCMCGCAGKYSFASAHVDRVKKQGHWITDNDVSDRSVKILVNKVNALLANGHVAEIGKGLDGDAFVCIETDTRRYVIYSVA